MLSKFTVLATLLALAAAAPSPAPVVENGLTLLESEITAEGWEVTYWGGDSTDTEFPAVERRQCGANIIDCHTSNVPTALATQNLLYHLQNTNSRVNSAPRSVCLTSNGQRACASWSVDVGSVQVNWLYNAARDTRNKCGASKSGRAREVNLGGRCTSQCLSNRPDGC